MKVLVEWVNSWYAPDKERYAAKKLLDEGADILSVSQDSPAVLQIVEKQGKLGFGYNSSMKHFAPDAYLTAPLWNWGELYQEIATAVHEGTWKSQEIWNGMNTGIVRLDFFSDKIPVKVRRLVRAKEEEIKSGKFHVFAGPIRDNTGKLQVPAGRRMTDKGMLCMNFVVEGVVDFEERLPVKPEERDNCCKEGGNWYVEKIYE